MMRELHRCNTTVRRELFLQQHLQTVISTGANVTQRAAKYYKNVFEMLSGQELGVVTEVSSGELGVRNLKFGDEWAACGMCLLLMGALTRGRVMV